MAMNIAALVVSVVSVMTALVAVGITIHLSKKAEQSLRKSTKVAVFATGQVLRILSQTHLPDLSEITHVGADIWRMSKRDYLVKPGGSIELTVEEIGTGPGPLHYPGESVPRLDWVVTNPWGRRFSGRTDYRQRDESHYYWRLVYPEDFAGADSNEEGMYTVECSVPDENYKRLFGAFVVLSS